MSLPCPHSARWTGHRPGPGRATVRLPSHTESQEAHHASNASHGCRRSERPSDRGFTLIELLVVVVIIGVLVAIAIPVYLNYRKGAANKSAQSDVRGAITAIEQYYTDNGNTYPAADVATAQTANVTMTCGDDVGTATLVVTEGQPAHVRLHGRPAGARTRSR